jgi:hypothetical protein
LCLAGLLAYAASGRPSRRLSGSGIEALPDGLFFSEFSIYSYGNSTGFAPVSLLIPMFRKPNTAANVSVLFFSCRMF